ncbi:MAG: cyanophycinase [Bacteroidia bacterium]
MIPKGRLLIIGGHENKGEIPGENLKIHKKKTGSTHFEILGTLILKAPRQHHVIEIIAAASSIPAEMEKLYIDSYKQAGFTKVGILEVETEESTTHPDSLKRIANAHAVFFTGGDQNKLISRMAGTELLKAIKNKYHTDEHFIVGGTSAGAMAMPETIITGGIIGAALYKGDIRIAHGLGLLPGTIVDTHFIKRGRFARLAHAVTLHPSCLGIGLEEDTALLISEGNKAECIGSGMVILIDGSHIKASNIIQVKDTDPIMVEDLRVSILAEGGQYLLNDRKWINP